MASKFPFDLKYHHVGIFVSNMEASAKWYKEMLGYEFMYKNVFPLPGQGDIPMGWLKHNNHYIELYEYACSPITKEPLKPFDMKDYLGTLGTKHLCLYVEDGQLVPLTKYLEDKGVKFMVKDHTWPKELTEKPDGCRVIYIYDPDGILIEIQETFKPGEY
ncbi:MAG: VOC family protein [Clostridiales bacterium]|jgi:catechol 2,3-dioxygenase-like lactoylglutathione lyase family enzyme|nr:VOC family protein [Clostridiales bacterium]